MAIQCSYVFSQSLDFFFYTAFLGGSKCCNKIYDLLITLSFQMWLFLRPSLVRNASVTTFLADFIFKGSSKFTRVVSWFQGYAIKFIQDILMCFNTFLPIEFPLLSQSEKNVEGTRSEKGHYES